MRRLSLIRSTLVVAATLLLVLSACGDDGDDQATTAADTTVAESSSTTASGASSTSEASGGSATTLPGEPTDFGPDAGADLAVVSVRFDDVLNVRAAPGADNDVVATLEPTGTATATGSSRMLDDGSIWDEIDAGGTTGWANSRFLSQPGAVDDITSQVISALDETPVEPNMEDLGMRVAAARVPEGGPDPTITLVVEASVGDLGEVTYDVIGYADDSIEGERLHVFGTPANGSFTLKSVEATTLCARGVDADGLCV